jgi:hypothetical protein
MGADEGDSAREERSGASRDHRESDRCRESSNGSMHELTYNRVVVPGRPRPLLIGRPGIRGIS